MNFDKGTGVISGTPSVTDWGADEESRDLPIEVLLQTQMVLLRLKTITITVQRDTDKDGDPDVTDPDDDNDGASDEEEKNAGTDPKDPTQRPMIPLTPIGSMTIDGNGQTVVEGNPIKDITVTPATKGAEISVGQLPDGLNFDKGTGVISGTQVLLTGVQMKKVVTSQLKLLLQTQMVLLRLKQSPLLFNVIQIKMEIQM
ncbi:Surface protein Rib [Streptococcus dysgalactiae subsp. equisimilis]|nr:Surface protein Rib [Streptococcus dysgalactiae subsp. equisimilis]